MGGGANENVITTGKSPPLTIFFDTVLENQKFQIIFPIYPAKTFKYIII